MNVKSTIEFNYKTKKASKIVYDTLEVDNENYLKSQLDGEKIIYKINSEKLGTFLSTVDDLIASEIVVEKITTETKKV